MKLTRRTAYLLGYVLADGSFEKSRHNHYSRLTIVSIDLELLEYAQSIAEELTGKRGSIAPRQLSLGKRPKYAFRISDQALVTWLADETSDRVYVPRPIFSADKVTKTAFAAGVLDGDGWLSIQREAKGWTEAHRGWKMQMGVAATYPWVFDLKRLLTQERVRTGEIQVRQTKAGKRITSFTINIESYLRWGGYFRCRRKEERLNEYRIWLRKQASPILRD